MKEFVTNYKLNLYDRHEHDTFEEYHTGLWHLFEEVGNGNDKEELKKSWRKIRKPAAGWTGIRELNLFCAEPENNNIFWNNKCVDGMKTGDMSYIKKKENYIRGKVSAVIPVFNGELYLSTLLDSILGQTYPQMEIILVDDGSMDKTVQMAEQYQERFAAKGYEYYIVQSDHKNASAAINQGLPYVTGEYLIWPDSDDRLERDSVEKRVNFLQSHPQYQCVRSLSYYYDSKTGKLVSADERTGDLSKEDLFWDILESRTYVCCGCYMLRTEPFFEIYPKRHIPEYDVGQNFQMLLPFMYYYPCPTMPERLYGVCVREGSHSRRQLTREEEYQKYHNYERLIDEIASICHMEDDSSRKRIMYWKIKRRYYLAVKYGNKKQAVKALWQMRKYGERKYILLLKDLIWIGLRKIQVKWTVSDNAGADKQ